jgi:hypothetical protein
MPAANFASAARATRSISLKYSTKNSVKTLLYSAKGRDSLSHREARTSCRSLQHHQHIILAVSTFTVHFSTIDLTARAKSGSFTRPPLAAVDGTEMLMAKMQMFKAVSNPTTIDIAVIFDICDLRCSDRREPWCPTLTQADASREERQARQTM